MIIPARRSNGKDSGSCRMVEQVHAGQDCRSSRRKKDCNWANRRPSSTRCMDCDSTGT